MSVASGVDACDLLLDGGVVITVDDEKRAIDNGAVAIKGDRIVAVGASVELAPYRQSTTRIVDCGGKVVMPGLTDGHTHLFQTLGRGMGDGLSLVPWLRRFMFPYAKTISGDLAVAGARLGALQAALSGTTVVVDNHYGPTDPSTTLAVAEGIESVGIRGAVARGIFGSPNRGSEIMGVAPELFPGPTTKSWPSPRNVSIPGRRVPRWRSGPVLRMSSTSRQISLQDQPNSPTTPAFAGTCTAPSLRPKSNSSSRSLECDRLPGWPKKGY